MIRVSDSWLSFCLYTDIISACQRWYPAEPGAADESSVPCVTETCKQAEICVTKPYFLWKCELGGFWEGDHTVFGGGGGAAVGGGKSSPTEYKEGAIEIDWKSSEPPPPPTQVINNDLSTGPLVRLFFWPSVRTVRSLEEKLEESYTEVKKRRKLLWKDSEHTVWLFGSERQKNIRNSDKNGEKSCGKGTVSIQFDCLDQSDRRILGTGIKMVRSLVGKRQWAYSLTVWIRATEEY